MTELLYTTPPSAILPLSKGEDVDVEFTYKTLVDDVFVETDFPDGAVVTLHVDPSASAAATVAGSKARATIDHTLMDRVPDCSLWRLVMTVADDVDRVLINVASDTPLETAALGVNLSAGMYWVGGATQGAADPQYRRYNVNTAEPEAAWIPLGTSLPSDNIKPVSIQRTSQSGAFSDWGDLTGGTQVWTQAAARMGFKVAA